MIHTLISGVLRTPDIGLGLRVQDTPKFAAGEQPFRVASPVLKNQAIPT